MHELSKQQQAIVDDARDGKGNTLVNALAGTGKTWSLTGVAEVLPPRASVLVCAFGKEIEKTLVARIKPVRPNAQVQTLHSFGRRVLMLASDGGVEYEHRKTDRIMDAVIGSDDTNPFLRAVRTVTKKVVSLAKAQLVSTAEQIDCLMDDFGVMVSPSLRDRVIDHAMEVLAASRKPPPRMDYDDMVWLPEVLGLPVPRFDHVLIDEWQDMTFGQIQLALRACKPGGRILAIGDRHQSIFGFRGAYAGTFDILVDKYGAKTLPLSVSYRCPRIVVEYARRFVPEFEAAPGAPMGEERETDIVGLMREVREGDFVLSRTNAPLATLCLAMLRKGMRVHVAGKDNGQRAIRFMQRSRSNSVAKLRDEVREWLAVERRRMTEKDRSTDLIEDVADTVEALCDGLTSVSEVVKRAEFIFADSEDAVEGKSEEDPTSSKRAPKTSDRIVLSTVHKAKGLERDRVFVLDGTFKPEKGGEESNLLYVAATRAKRSLIHVTGFEKTSRGTP